MTRPMKTVSERVREYLKRTGQLNKAVAVIGDALYNEALGAVRERNMIVYGTNRPKPSGDVLFRGTLLLTRKMAADWLARYRKIRETAG